MVALVDNPQLAQKNGGVPDISPWQISDEGQIAVINQPQADQALLSDINFSDRLNSNDPTQLETAPQTRLAKTEIVISAGAEELVVASQNIERNKLQLPLNNDSNFGVLKIPGGYATYIEEQKPIQTQSVTDEAKYQSNKLESNKLTETAKKILKMAVSIHPLLSKPFHAAASLMLKVAEVLRSKKTTQDEPKVQNGPKSKAYSVIITLDNAATGKFTQVMHAVTPEITSPPTKAVIKLREGRVTQAVLIGDRAIVTNDLNTEILKVKKDYKVVNSGRVDPAEDTVANTNQPSILASSKLPKLLAA